MILECQIQLLIRVRNSDLYFVKEDFEDFEDLLMRIHYLNLYDTTLLFYELIYYYIIYIIFIIIYYYKYFFYE